MFFVGILTDYLLPMIYDSLVTLILVLLVLFIFRIKDSNIRILFFFLPLIKPFLIILERVDIDKFHLLYDPVSSGIRFPDPTNIIKTVEGFNTGPLIFISNPDYLILFIIISGILSVLIIRWIALALFYRRLAYEEKVSRKDVPEIFNIIDRYIAAVKIKHPDVSLTHRSFFSPFIVGVRNFTLVLSPNLMEKLNTSEKETIIYHELSHIKRRDNLIGWIALILRDLLFFNPFAYIAYFLIRSEQEKGSDKLMVKYSDKNPKEIARDILNAILKIKAIAPSIFSVETAQKFVSSPYNLFGQKRLKNRVNSILSIDPARIYSRIFPRILMYALFLVLLLIQVILVININDLLLFLR